MKYQKRVNEHEISECSNRESGPTFLDFPLFQGIFQSDEPTKRFPFTAEPKFPEILNEKRPALICGDGAEVKVMEAVVVMCLKAVMVVVQMAHSPNDVKD